MASTAGPPYSTVQLVTSRSCYLGITDSLYKEKKCKDKTLSKAEAVQDVEVYSR